MRLSVWSAGGACGETMLPAAGGVFGLRGPGIECGQNFV